MQESSSSTRERERKRCVREREVRGGEKER